MNHMAGKCAALFIFWVWVQWVSADTMVAPPNFVASPQAPSSILRRHAPPHVIARRSPDNPSLVSLAFYLDGQLTGTLVYRNGMPFEGTLVEPPDDGPLYHVHHLIFHGKRIYITRKDLYQTAQLGRSEKYPLKTWYYHFDKDRPNTLRQMDRYGQQNRQVIERRLFDENEKLVGTALFEYDPSQDAASSDPMGSVSSVRRICLRNARGELVQEYEESVAIDLEQHLRKSGLTASEIRRRRAVAADPSRTPLLIFDSGIDIGHPALAHKMWRNLDDPINGLDDDGNGLVDDHYGISDNPRLGHPVEDLRLPRFGLPGFSHGTFVASVATRDRDDVAIMAVSEITTINSQELFDKAEQFIKAHKVRFTNMSFVFDKLIMDFGASFDRARQLKDLIANTPNTLHLVASGNGTSMGAEGIDVDRLRQAQELIPAMLEFQNVLVVGALATHELKLQDYPRYRLANFSNVGSESVDILAPGYQMRGARLGGGDMVADGTSFAAPYLFNHGVMNIVRANPSLDIYQIKEIILKTAYVPDLEMPFPVRCGGILHPERATAVAQFLFRKPHHTIDEAVLAVRRRESITLTGEPNDDAYFFALQQFWARRGLGNVDLWIVQKAR